MWKKGREFLDQKICLLSYWTDMFIPDVSLFKHSNLHANYVIGSLPESQDWTVLRDEIPVIRRFTGGGTVIVHRGTIFISSICSWDAAPGLQPYPRAIISQSRVICHPVFWGIDDFHLRENGTLLHFLGSISILSLMPSGAKKSRYDYR